MEKQRYERPGLKKLNTGIPDKFGALKQFPPTTHIEGVSVKELISEYGSPLFVLSERKIKEL